MASPSNDPDTLARLLRRRADEGGLEVVVEGSSMGDVIASDSTVSIGSYRKARPGEVWAFVADTGRVVVHRVRRFEEGLVVTRGAGNSIDDHPISPARLIGPVMRATAPNGSTRTFATADRVRSAVSFRVRALLRRLLG